MKRKTSEKSANEFYKDRILSENSKKMDLEVPYSFSQMCCTCADIANSAGSVKLALIN
jgi:hypothetical protein